MTIIRFNIVYVCVPVFTYKWRALKGCIIAPTHCRISYSLGAFFGEFTFIWFFFSNVQLSEGVFDKILLKSRKIVTTAL